MDRSVGVDVVVGCCGEENAGGGCSRWPRRRWFCVDEREMGQFMGLLERGDYGSVVGCCGEEENQKGGAMCCWLEKEKKMGARCGG